MVWEQSLSHAEGTSEDESVCRLVMYRRTAAGLTAATGSS